MLSCIHNGVSEAPADDPNTNICRNETERHKSFVTLDRVVLKTWFSFICWFVLLECALRTEPLNFALVTRHGSITRPPPGTGYVVLVLLALSLSDPLQPSRIKVNFKNSNGDLLKTVEVNEGDDILSIAHEHDIDLEGA